MPQQVLDDALEQLVRAELVFRRGTPPDAEYTFKHALVQDAAYSTLLRSTRQLLHGRIAAALESRFTEIVETQPQLLAHHCAEAGLTGQSDLLPSADSAFYPIISQLERAARLAHDDTTQTKLDKLDAMLAQHQGYARLLSENTL